MVLFGSGETILVMGFECMRARAKRFCLNFSGRGDFYYLVG